MHPLHALALAGFGVYLFGRRKSVKLAGIDDDVQRVVDQVWGEVTDSHWWSSPRNRDVEDGPIDRRPGYARIKQDRSGNPVVILEEEFNCKHLNSTLRGLIEAKNDLTKFILSNDPSDLEKLEVDEFEERGIVKRPFNAEMIEDLEFDLDERIEATRAVARANGCQNIR